MDGLLRILKNVGVILVILSLVGIIIVRILIQKRDNAHTEHKDADKEAVSNSENLENKNIGEPTGNIPDDELVAVLTAAVMASMKGQHVYNFRIKSFKRLPQNTPIWNRAGRMEYISNKL